MILKRELEKKNLKGWHLTMDKLLISSDFNRFKQCFLYENSVINLISKNDEKFLYEKHFYDSLAIKYFFDKYKYLPQKILDIGTGGGFPSVPLAMEYPKLKIFGIDSISKKICAVNRIKDKLNLNNLSLINDRVENLKNEKFDLIVSRAVSKISTMIEYAYPLLENKGYIVLYKSLNINNELDEAKNIIRKYKLKIKPLIEYTLPLEEKYTRYLLVLER